MLVNNGPGAQAALNMTKALGSVKPFIKICYAVSGTAFEKMLDHFSKFEDTSSFLTKFFMNAVSKTFNLQQIISQIQDDRASGNFTGIFYQTGRVLRMLLDFDPEDRLNTFVAPKDVADHGDHSDDDPLERLFHFVVGFVNATKVMTEAPGNETLCLENFETFDGTIKDIPTFVQQQQYEQAIYAIADVFGLLYPTTRTCILTGEEVIDSASDYSHVYESPWKLMMNIVYHFGDLYDTGVQMVKCFGTYDATCSGRSLGHLVHLIFFNN
jgi:hypothetical protein